MNNNATSKIHAAKQNWHNTIGEYVLRYAGIILALTVVVVGLMYGYKSSLTTPKAGPGHVIKYDSDRTEKTLLFVTVNSDQAYAGEAKVLKEAIASYHGVKVISLQGNFDNQNLQKKNQVIFVFGSPQIDNLKGLISLMTKVADKKIPLFWMGSGFSHVAQLFEIPFSLQDDQAITPLNTYMTYKGTKIAAEGLPFTRSNLAELAGKNKVLARVKLHNTFTRVALLRHGNIIYSAFSPFSQGEAPFALSVIMDSLSLLVGTHKPDPRVIFRLEDINGSAYNQNDSSFRKTVDYLIKQGVYVHLGIIPTMVDDQDNVHSNIDAALPVLEFIKKNPGHAGVVQHGYKHFRKDPRNKGMGSGDAFEFFMDDDKTMGPKAAAQFARKVIKEGYAVMLKSGLQPQMFEAPHYLMSQAEQQAAEQMFSLMQHEPLFYGDSPYGFFLPWLTQRNTTVYAASSSGYVDSEDPDSVNNILYSLEKAALIIPDPVIVVFFHPFMKEFKGREDDLEKLVQGIKKLNYRFVNMVDEVVPVTAKP